MSTDEASGLAGAGSRSDDRVAIRRPVDYRKRIFMTKSELIDAVASAANVSKADAERTIGAFFDTVVANAKKGDKVAWPGFGSFSTSQRPARTGRNPRTGAPVQIAASTAMKFSASSTLKANLNGK